MRGMPAPSPPHFVASGAFTHDLRMPRDQWFRWKSGILAPCGCNCRRLDTVPALRRLVDDALADATCSSFPGADYIVAVAHAGIPWAKTVAQRLDIPLAYVRAEARESGGPLVECEPGTGDQAVIIEDEVLDGARGGNAQRGRRQPAPALLRRPAQAPLAFWPRGPHCLIRSHLNATRVSIQVTPRFKETPITNRTSGPSSGHSDATCVSSRSVLNLFETTYYELRRNLDDHHDSSLRSFHLASAVTCQQAGKRSNRKVEAAWVASITRLSFFSASIR
jgi:hypothetical protein